VKTSALIVAALLAAAAAAGTALAADRMYSFSPDSETAHRLTGDGQGMANPTACKRKQSRSTVSVDARVHGYRGGSRAGASRQRLA